MLIYFASFTAITQVTLLPTSWVPMRVRSPLSAMLKMAILPEPSPAPKR